MQSKSPKLKWPVFWLQKNRNLNGETLYEDIKPSKRNLAWLFSRKQNDLLEDKRLTVLVHRSQLVNETSSSRIEYRNRNVAKIGDETVDSEVSQMMEEMNARQQIANDWSWRWFICVYMKRYNNLMHFSFYRI